MSETDEKFDITLTKLAEYLVCHEFSPEVIGDILNSTIAFQGRDNTLTPCMRAARDIDNPAVLQYLIDSGADIEAVRFGYTALGFAVSGNKNENCKTLLKAGAKISGAGISVLHIAVGRQDISLAQMFLEAGADPNGLDVFENPPLSSISSHHTNINEMLSLFIRFGARVSDVVTKRDGFLLLDTVHQSTKPQKSLITLVQAGISERLHRPFYRLPVSSLSEISNPFGSGLAILYAAGILNQFTNMDHISLHCTFPRDQFDTDFLLRRLTRAGHAVIKNFDDSFVFVGVGLQELGLPALVTCEILQALLFRWPRFRYCDFWNRVVLIKHFV